MDKPFVLGQLQNTVHVFVLGMAATTLLATPEVRPVLRNAKSVFGTYEVKFDQVADMLDHPESGPHHLFELIKSQLRSFVSDSYRLIESYAVESKQAHVLRSAPWYNFARIIRNALAHDVRFIFTPNDQKLMPITWQKTTIDASLEGKELSLQLFTPEDAYRLFEEMCQFVKVNLT